MPETNYRILRLAHRGRALLAVSALLAFALFPGLAIAQDSSEVQYSDAPPSLPGKASQDESAKASNADRADRSGQSSTGSGSTGDGKAGADGGKGDADGGGKANDAGDEDGDKGAAGQGGGDGGGNNGGGVQVEPVPAAADDGGSSPLVPILIALAVLGAISFAVVAMRKRGEEADPGAPASPGAR